MRRNVFRNLFQRRLLGGILIAGLLAAPVALSRNNEVLRSILSRARGPGSLLPDTEEFKDLHREFNLIYATDGRIGVPQFARMVNGFIETEKSRWGNRFEEGWRVRRAELVEDLHRRMLSSADLEIQSKAIQQLSQLEVRRPATLALILRLATQGRGKVRYEALKWLKEMNQARRLSDGALADTQVVAASKGLAEEVRRLPQQKVLVDALGALNQRIVGVLDRPGVPQAKAQAIWAIGAMGFWTPVNLTSVGNHLGSPTLELRDAAIQVLTAAGRSPGGLQLFSDSVLAEIQRTITTLSSNSTEDSIRRFQLQSLLEEVKDSWLARLKVAKDDGTIRRLFRHFSKDPDLEVQKVLLAHQSLAPEVEVAEETGKNEIPEAKVRPLELEKQGATEPAAPQAPVNTEREENLRRVELDSVRTQRVAPLADPVQVLIRSLQSLSPEMSGSDRMALFGFFSRRNSGASEQDLRQVFKLGPKDMAASSDLPAIQSLLSLQKTYGKSLLPEEIWEMLWQQLARDFQTQSSALRSKPQQDAEWRLARLKLPIPLSLDEASRIAEVVLLDRFPESTRQGALKEIDQALEARGIRSRVWEPALWTLADIALWSTDEGPRQKLWGLVLSQPEYPSFFVDKLAGTNPESLRITDSDRGIIRYNLKLALEDPRRLWPAIQLMISPIVGGAEDVVIAGLEKLSQLKEWPPQAEEWVAEWLADSRLEVQIAALKTLRGRTAYAEATWNKMNALLSASVAGKKAEVIQEVLLFAEKEWSPEFAKTVVEGAEVVVDLAGEERIQKALNAQSRLPKYLVDIILPKVTAAELLNWPGDFSYRRSERFNGKYYINPRNTGDSHLYPYSRRNQYLDTLRPISRWHGLLLRFYQQKAADLAFEDGFGNVDEGILVYRLAEYIQKVMTRLKFEQAWIYRECLGGDNINEFVDGSIVQAKEARANFDKIFGDAMSEVPPPGEGERLRAFALPLIKNAGMVRTPRIAANDAAAILAAVQTDVSATAADSAHVAVLTDLNEMLAGNVDDATLRDLLLPTLELTQRMPVEAKPLLVKSAESSDPRIAFRAARLLNLHWPGEFTTTCLSKAMRLPAENSSRR